VMCSSDAMGQRQHDLKLVSSNPRPNKQIGLGILSEQHLSSSFIETARGSAVPTPSKPKVHVQMPGRCARAQPMHKVHRAQVHRTIIFMPERTSHKSCSITVM
jgi:hypothetical protein